MFLVTLQSMLVLFIVVALGFISGKIKLFSKTADKDFSKLLTSFIVPAAVINSMAIPFEQELLVSAGYLVVFTIMFQMIGLVCGIILAKYFKLSITEKPIFVFGLTFTNVGNMGLPVISSLLGEESVFYVSIAMATFSIMTYTLGMFIMMGKSEEKTSILKSLSNVLRTPAVIAAIIGMFIFIFSIELPEIIDNTIDLLSGVMSPLAMFTVGLILSYASIRVVFKDYRLLILTVIKLLVIPMIVLLLCLIINLDPLLSKTIVLLSSMPSAAMTAILAARYDKNKLMGSQVVMITTICSILTIPLVNVIINMFI